MYKRVLALFVPGLLLVMLAGCESPPTFPAPPRSGLIHITNNSVHDVSIFRYRVSGQIDWGRNIIDKGSDILSGDYAEYYMPPGSLDVRLETADEVYFWNFKQVDVPLNGTYTLTLY